MSELVDPLPSGRFWLTGLIEESWCCVVTAREVVVALEWVVDDFAALLVSPFC